jgi:cytidylate kinase
MSAITISREVGSLGDTIAEQVASRLGYQLVDKHTIEKIFIQFGYIDFKESYNTTGFWMHFDPRRAEMVSFLNRVIEALIAHGKIVLLGRGGFALLKGYADVLNARIQAPFPLRAGRVFDGGGFASLAQAEEFVREDDRMRRDFVNSMYAERWDSVSAFDLVLDTGKISPEQAADWLEAAGRQVSLLQPGEAHTTRAIEIDPVLADSVAQVLDGQAA